MKYVYSIYEADERGKCPICGKTKELFYKSEKREYYNPITNKNSLTAYGCRVYDAACYDCQKAKQNKGI